MRSAISFPAVLPPDCAQPDMASSIPAQIAAIILFFKVFTSRFTFYFLFLVRKIPIAAAMRTNGASLTNSHSKPCRKVPATAASGSL